MKYLFIFFWFLSVCSIAQVADDPLPGKMAGQPSNVSGTRDDGLLFYLSGNSGFKADFSQGGQYLPNYLKNVSVIDGGAKGKGFSAGDDQLWSYWAPGNIYSQRGTVSFFWRSRYPAGSTPFPIFRVSYADHSSWDMVWLRIDYNGAGFDAFVTDIGLSRTRVSYYPEKIPDPGEWVHIALTWDETDGVTLYVNGVYAARQTASPAIFDAGLDQFGPNSRIISPYQVQSAYCFMRGGDIDELRIYDQALTGENITQLFTGNEPRMTALRRNLAERKWRDEWWLRNGWNLPNPPPPLLPGRKTSIRKVEINDAFDIRRWYWKANDGIRETTWPGVYNMSRLPGRYDYFVLPDWDCYSGSGQTIRFTIPGETWNHIEVWGKAWGQLTYENGIDPDVTFASRKSNQIKSVHRLSNPYKGGIIRFDNAVIEEPIGSLDVYNVEYGNAPETAAADVFRPVPGQGPFTEPAIASLASFISGRYPSDERSMMVADTDSSHLSKGIQQNSLPFIHVLIPYTGRVGRGLDGVEISFPELRVSPTHNGTFPMNIRIKDPLWPMRDLADFSFSVKPGESPVLWFDTRDRILPEGHALYITISGAGADLTPGLLNGLIVRLVYKPAAIAKEEHVADRFTQVRDLYGHIVEEHPASSRLNLYNRFIADCNDLLKVSPGHWLGQTYRYAATGRNKPAFNVPACPEGVPEWAFLQAEYMRRLEKLVSFYIDKRQIANGEFGGGLSDDGDLTNMWPGLAFLGIDPEKITRSLRLHMSAYLDNERSSFYSGLKQRSLPLFTNGLATITTDELHALEDGIQVVAQMQLLLYGNPYWMEKGMETSLKLADNVTGVNSAGHRHFRSRLYGGNRIVPEDPWQWSVNRSYLVLHPSYLAARYNGNEKIRDMITGLADGLLAHTRNGIMYTDIHFETDADREDTGMAKGSKPWALFQAAYSLTGDKKYFDVLPAGNPGKGKFDPEKIAERYRNEITTLGIFEFINTEGSTWIDRISSFNPQIQEDRLGGVALTRTSALYPTHYVSWKFTDPSAFDDVAIFLPSPGGEKLKIIGYNLENTTVNAVMTTWDIVPGKWMIESGIDSNGDLEIDKQRISSTAEIERGSAVPVSFLPRKQTIIDLSLIQPSGKEYDKLPDPAFGPEDLRIDGRSVYVRVHNIGAAVSPSLEMVVRNESGRIIAKASVPALEAPTDLLPRRTDVKIEMPEGTDPWKCRIELDPGMRLQEITRLNNILNLNDIKERLW